MSTTTPSTPQTFDTPSKKVAASLANIDVNSSPSKKPTNSANTTILASNTFDDADFLAKAKANAQESKEIVKSQGRHGKFVGEDIPEEEEPLLVESNRRFVLFPIRYHEVSQSFLSPFFSLSCSSWLEQVLDASLDEVGLKIT